ncbi:general secretion pathway protein GspB [Tahibacter harae]|uniref:General secretion pathway protein GspB n=1 Tax=Tahibacter harae TaxID=2963937 RepID=A0ABT1QZ01_9GAMM|nr:general secretion pathway protein GspB [Tahibacter harae]MCQ4167520.1 general secretion pathway protein GspB [Tahibacter harae]
MSLIHEALKKAEQQRRLGEPPNLGTPFAATRRRRTLLPYLAVAIAAALGAGWWLSRDRAPEAPAQAAAPASQTAGKARTADAPANVPASGAAAAAAANSQAASSAAERRPVMGANATANTNVVTSLAPPPRLNHQAPAPSNPPTVKEVAERESEPHPPGANPLAPGEAAPLALGTPPPETPLNDPAGVAAKMAVKEKQLAATPAAATAAGQPATRQPPSFPSAAPPEDQSAPPPVAAVSKSTPAAPPSLPPPPAQPVAAAQKPQPAAATAPPTPPPAQPVAAAAQKPQPAAVPPPPTPPPPQPVAAAAPPLEQLPAYWQLPYNVRKELPALKLSMHVYSATPAQRFVVLNGNRQVEGDELGGEVRVTEIRSDGVVLSFQGQRFLVPRGGS